MCWHHTGGPEAECQKATVLNSGTASEWSARPSGLPAASLVEVSGRPPPGGQMPCASRPSRACCVSSRGLEPHSIATSASLFIGLTFLLSLLCPPTLRCCYCSSPSSTRSASAIPSQGSSCSRPVLLFAAVLRHPHVRPIARSFRCSAVAKYARCCWLCFCMHAARLSLSYDKQTPRSSRDSYRIGSIPSMRLQIRPYSASVAGLSQNVAI